MGKTLHCEIIFTEKCIIKYVQKESFAGLQNERIVSLFSFLDNEVIVRLKTKVVERADLRDFGISAVLLSRYPVVMFVLRAHEKACHVGVQGLLSRLRERFWFLKGR